MTFISEFNKEERIRILIVDDEAALLKALCDTLSDEGFETIGFTKASEALSELKKSNFDLLLSDLMMPEMDGISVLEKAIAIDKNLAVIIMTGQGTVDTAVEAMRKGALDYILKPFKMKAVLLVLTRAYGLRKLRIENEKLTEELRIARDTAEQATIAKSNFLANMSHEIRTPVNAIMGMNRLLYNTGLNEKQKDYSVKINMASQTLLSIINDVLDFSKIEAGKLELENVTLNINDILNNLANIVSVKAQEKGLEIIFAMDKNMPVLLKGDPMRLQQILLNLISNAIKFTEEGHIIVSSKVLKDTGTNLEISFSVKDTGIGISKEDQSRLFKTFSQADSSTSRRFGGSGLGLSINKRLVEMMQGKIGVNSERGKGSEFFFTACFGSEEQKENVFIQPPVDLKGLRVLVVDDIKDIRNVICDQLQMFTFNATAVGSASEAIDELRNALVTGKKYYDLVIMDWKMEGINGIKASQLIINDPEIAHKPKIILISAYLDKEAISQENVASINAFMNKPFSLSRLLNTILNVFGKEVKEKYLTNGFIVKTPPGFDKIKGARILLVEDNEINQQVALETLENEGFWVTVANNGLEALVKLQNSGVNQVFDIVLMDLQMPEMDGFQAAQEIRKIKKFEELPIIAMTADVVGDVRIRCMDAGMNGYVSKPIEPLDLYKALVEWIKPGNREIYHDLKQSADSDSNNILEKHFLSLKNFNVKSGLQRVNQNYELYKKLLIKFKTNYTHFSSEMKQALKNNDFELSVRLAHTLKGVSGNLGAEDLYRVTKELEAALSENNTKQINEFLERSNVELEKTLDSVRIFEELVSEETEHGDKNIVQTGEILTRLEEAQTLLIEYDAEAVSKIETLYGSLKHYGYKEEIKSLQQALGAYDFENALPLVQKLLIQLKKPK